MAPRTRRLGQSWSVEVGRVFDIPIRLHLTFFILLFWFGGVSAQQGRGFLSGVLFIALLFGSVVLHELGHAVAALGYGVRTREIVLYPIGGVAKLEGMPIGMPELVIALAGPVVNLVLAALLLAAAALAGLPLPASPGELGAISGPSGLLLIAAFANGVLFVFNLLPAFPMDGGRVLRALLTLGLGEDRATEIAAMIGQGLAVAMAVFSFTPIGGVVLLLVAIFVFVGAGQEVAAQRTRSLVKGRTAAEAMVTRFTRLHSHDSLGLAAELLLTTPQRDFPVIDAWGRLAGLLTRGGILTGLRDLGPEGAVLDAMRRDPTTVPGDLPLLDLFPLLQRDPSAPLMVVEGGELRGMISLESVGQLVEVWRHVGEGAARE